MTTDMDMYMFINQILTSLSIFVLNRNKNKLDIDNTNKNMDINRIVKLYEPSNERITVCNVN